MTKPGFSVIELMIVIALASLMSLALFQSFYQSNRIVQRADLMMDVDERIIHIQDRLENDISGAPAHFQGHRSRFPISWRQHWRHEGSCSSWTARSSACHESQPSGSYGRSGNTPIRPWRHTSPSRRGSGQSRTNVRFSPNLFLPWGGSISEHADGDRKSTRLNSSH